MSDNKKTAQPKISLKEVKEAVLKEKAKKKCVACGDVALLCMRGLPDNTYCKPCAKDYFKLLSYLDKLKK